MQTTQSIQGELGGVEGGEAVPTHRNVGQVWVAMEEARGQITDPRVVVHREASEERVVNESPGK